MSECRSFSYQINNQSKILILGSMPGVKSLELQEYYAHPQNRFWKVMGALCHCPDLAELKYDEKINVLLNSGFALWDTISFCKREGSLDSDIVEEVPNNIPDLLKKYNNIKIIILNGNKSYSTFKKCFPELLTTYTCIKVPSTSPANARFTLEKLILEWKKVVE